MEETKKAPTQSRADSIEALKQKYGAQLYEIGITVPLDDMNSKDFSYRFKRPATQSYDRFIRTASKVGATKASEVFMLDAVIDEDKDRLVADIAENPGIAIMIGNKLTEILGLSDTVNLKKL